LSPSLQVHPAVKSRRRSENKMTIEGTVTPEAGTETPVGTVTPVDTGHGNFFEFSDDSGNPLDTTSKPFVHEPVNTPEPIIEKAPIVEPKDTPLEPNIKEQFGFELETYDDKGISTPEVDKPLDAQEPVKPKDNPTSQEYWQSQADKTGGELSYVLGTLGIPSIEEFKTNYNKYKNIMPIAQYVKDNPQILDVVDQSLSNSPAGQPKPGVQAVELKKPEAPAAPQGYNKLDAVQDPESDSWAYREKVEKHNQDLMNYQIELLNKEKTDFQNQQRATAQEQQLRSTHTQLVNQYKLEPNDATDFINYMSSPQSQNLDNLVMLWKMKNAPKGSVQQNLEKANAFRARAEKIDNMKPGLGGNTGGAQVRPLTDEEEFNLSLLQHRRV